MRAPEGNFYHSATATSSPTFLLEGGVYAVSVLQTGAGSVKLQRVGPDGSTLLDLTEPFNNAGTEADLVVGTFAGNLCKSRLYLGPGTYQWTVTTSTAIFAELVRIPYE